MQWREWTALNRQLMDEWRLLLAAGAVTADAPATPTPSAPAIAAETLAFDPMIEAFHALTEDIFCTFETGRGCTALSPSWQRITGCAPEAALRDQFYRLLPEQQVKPFIAALQQAVCDRTPLQEPLAFSLIAANGTSLAFELHIGAVERMENGQDQLICRLKNVQEIAETREALRQARAETERALRTRSEFLNGMSHELRTPLNAILGFTQIMENGIYGEIENAQYRDYMRHIRESSYELLAQIDDLMDVASIDSGATTLHYSRQDLSELLAECVLLHRSHAQEVNVSISCQVLPACAIALVDRVKLQHCISHILANAVRHSYPGGCVSIVASTNDNGELCLTVADQGSGMSARKLQGLISALQRDDSWAKRNANGLGLGLPLAKEFARLHGGYLVVDSKAGEGTRVTVHLPPSCLPGYEEDVKALEYRILAG